MRYHSTLQGVHCRGQFVCHSCPRGRASFCCVWTACSEWQDSRTGVPELWRTEKILCLERLFTFPDLVGSLLGKLTGITSGRFSERFSLL